MTEELEDKLYQRFPYLLNRFTSRKPNSSFVISCDDGWYDNIYDCLSKVDYVCSLTNNKLEIMEIKEKFGELIIYIDFVNNADEGLEMINQIIKDIIKSAAESSKKICEVSGNYGNLCSDKNKYKTLSYEVVRNNDKYKQYRPISNNIAELWIHYDNHKSYQ